MDSEHVRRNFQLINNARMASSSVRTWAASQASADVDGAVGEAA
jgi:hypothetical protein